MAENWYCKIVGQEVGPLTRDELREMLHAGQISCDDRIRSPNQSAWQRLSRVFPEMAAATVDRRSWHFRSFGDEFGPYTFNELKDFVAQQQLTAADDVRDGTTGPWRQARLVEDLFPEHDNILTGLETLDDAPEEPKRKPRPTRQPATSAAPLPRPKTPGEAARETKAALPPEPPDRHAVEETPAAARAEMPAPAVPVASPPTSLPPSSTIPVAATSGMATATLGSPPSSPPAVPRPSYTPPPASRSSQGGGGFELPDWLGDGKTIGIAVGIIVLLGGGWFLMSSNLLSSFNAAEVYTEVVALYDEFKAASASGRNSPAFTGFYGKFKEKQYELFESIGQPERDTSAYEVKQALQFLGSVIEGFKRESTSEQAQQTYVKALENQLKKLEAEYGGGGGG